MLFAVLAHEWNFRGLDTDCGSGEIDHRVRSILHLLVHKHVRPDF
jgi:hypothetical protein